MADPNIFKDLVIPDPDAFRQMANHFQDWSSQHEEYMQQLDAGHSNLKMSWEGDGADAYSQLHVRAQAVSDLHQQQRQQASDILNTTADNAQTAVWKQAAIIALVAGAVGLGILAIFTFGATAPEAAAAGAEAIELATIGEAALGTASTTLGSGFLGLFGGLTGAETFGILGILGIAGVIPGIIVVSGGDGNGLVPVPPPPPPPPSPPAQPPPPPPPLPPVQPPPMQPPPPPPPPPRPAGGPPGGSIAVGQQTVQVWDYQGNPVNVQVQVLSPRDLMNLYLQNQPGVWDVAEFGPYNNSDAEWAMVQDMVPDAFTDANTGEIFVNANAGQNRLQAIVAHEANHAASFNHQGMRTSNVLADQGSNTLLDEAVTEYFTIRPLNPAQRSQYMQNSSYGQLGDRIANMINNGVFTEQTLIDAYYHGDPAAIATLQQHRDQIAAMLAG